MPPFFDDRESITHMFFDIEPKETLINSALPVHANRHLLYNRHIKNTGEKPHESTIL